MADLEKSPGWVVAVSFLLQVVDRLAVDHYDGLADRGLDSAEVTVLDARGRVVVDLDPMSTGRRLPNQDPDVLLELNLAKDGVLAARDAIAGRSGVTRSRDRRKAIDQVTGFAPVPGVPLAAAGRDGARRSATRCPGDATLVDRSTTAARETARSAADVDREAARMRTLLEGFQLAEQQPVYDVA